MTMPMAGTREEVALPPRGHLLALDGVRGLAILMVICSHAFESNSDSAGPLVRLIGRLFFYGYFGVDLFFALSGFLITGILIDSLRDEGYFRKFYARRALRIFPLYYGVLGVCLLLTHPLHLAWHGMNWLLLFYLQNLRPAEIMQFTAGHGVNLYHFWSLAVEEQFYLVWPAIVFMVRGRRALLWVTACGAIAALVLRCVLVGAGVSAYVLHVNTACRADALLLGGLLAVLYRSASWDRVLKVAVGGFLGLLAILLLGLALMDQLVVARPPLLLAHPVLDVVWHGCLSYSVAAAMFTCLIACALRPGSRLQSFFQVAWLRFLGKYSYGLYVLHVFVLDLGLPLRDTILKWTHSKAAAVGGAGILELAIAIALAWVSYHLYERPFLRMKHYFDYSRRSLNQGAPEDAGIVAATTLL
jgi:peptidoglycan/LPS O-acetylase OafA/YrhL